MPHETERFCCAHCSHRIERKKDLVEVEGHKLHKKCAKKFEPPAPATKVSELFV